MRRVAVGHGPGVTRRARGEAFVTYINGQLGATSKMTIVPECGHKDRRVHAPVIFPVMPGSAPGIDAAYDWPAIAATTRAVVSKEVGQPYRT